MDEHAFHDERGTPTTAAGMRDAAERLAAAAVRTENAAERMAAMRRWQNFQAAYESLVGESTATPEQPAARPAHSAPRLSEEAVPVTRSSARRRGPAVLGAVLLAAAICGALAFNHFTYSSAQHEAERLGYRGLGNVTYTSFAPDHRLIDVEPGAPAVSDINWLGDVTNRVLGALRTYGYTCERHVGVDADTTYWSCEGTDFGGKLVRADLRYRSESGIVPEPGAAPFEPETVLHMQIRR